MQPGRPSIPSGVRVPGAHLGLRWVLAGAQHTDAVIELVRSVEQAERPARVLSDQEIAWLVAGQEAHALVGFDPGGLARGFASVSPAGEPGEYRGTGLVSPQWRGLGIGRALLAWQVMMVRHLCAAAGAQNGSFVALVDDSHVGRRRLHAAAGFSSRRSTVLMSADLSSPEGDPALVEREMVRLGDSGGWDTNVLDRLWDAACELAATRDVAGRGAQAPNAFLRAADPSASLALLAGDDLLGVIVTGFPAPAPHLAPAGADPAGWCQAETRMLAAADEEVARDLVLLTRRELRERGVRSHVCEIDMASPLRSTLADLRYVSEGTATRWTVDL